MAMTNIHMSIQYASELDQTPTLDVADTQHVQEVVGILLCYAQAIDAKLLTALSTLAAQQAHGT